MVYLPVTHVLTIDPTNVGTVTTVPSCHLSKIIETKQQQDFKLNCRVIQITPLHYIPMTLKLVRRNMFKSNCTRNVRERHSFWCKIFVQALSLH